MTTLLFLIVSIPGILLRVVVLTSILLAFVQGFNSPSESCHYSRPVVVAATKLYYHNDNDNNEKDHSLHRLILDPHAILTVPVLGYPIPGQAPLLVMGNEFTLSANQITPMQWHAIEEAVWNHQQHVIQSNRQDQEEPPIPTCSSIDAAPLVAIMDETTSSLSSTSKFMHGGRYATIAAILGGFSSSSSSPSTSIDTSDNASFMESLRQATTNPKTTTPSLWNSNVRLLGVGRAVIYDFYYQIPTRIAQDTIDDEGYLLKSRNLSSSTIMDEKVEDDDDDDDDDVDLQEQVLMAHFKVLRDNNDVDPHHRPRSSSSTSSRSGGSTNSHSCSPVHYVAAMARLAQHLEFLHQDRRQLVTGLHAAKARLNLRDWKDYNNKKKINDNDDSDDFLQDYDGLGMLMSSHVEYGKEREATQQAIDKLLEMTSPPAKTSPSTTTTISSLADVLENDNNYGMGYTSTSVSKLNELTRLILQERLNTYYSHECRIQSEEFYYEMFSFVVISSLDEFLKLEQQPAAKSS